MASLIDRLYNFHWIKKGAAARSSQAFFGGLTGMMTRHGLKAIINLRGENADLSWWRYERAACEKTGARHIDAQMSSRHLPTRAMLVRLIESFETAPRPFLLKCSGGHDRTALAAALFVIHDGGWQAVSEAEKQFDAHLYGHTPKKHQFWLKPFLTFAAEAAQGVPLAAWIKERYTPEALAGWLSDRGLGDSHKGIFEKPVRSPFQL
jgi:Protein tyrosine/serine phosphatase